MRAYLCPKCSNPTSSSHVCSGYFRACLLCDEDFYKWEMTVVKRTRVLLRRMKRLLKRYALINGEA